MEELPVRFLENIYLISTSFTRLTGAWQNLSGYYSAISKQMTDSHQLCVYIDILVDDLKKMRYSVQYMKSWNFDANPESWEEAVEGTRYFSIFSIFVRPEDSRYRWPLVTWNDPTFLRLLANSWRFAECSFRSTAGHEQALLKILAERNMRPLGTLTVLNSPVSLQVLDVEMKSGFLRTISVNIWGTSFTDQDFRKVVEAFLESPVFVLNLEHYRRSDKPAEVMKTIFGIWNTYPKTAVTTGKMVSLCTYAGISIDTDKFVEGENWVVEKEECGEATIIRIKDQDSAHSLKIFKEDLWLL